MSIIEVEHPTINTSSFEPQNRKNGISGLMRVRDEEEFIAQVIESWIDYIDELVIVFHQCTDKTPQIIEQYQIKYPHKIRAFHYLPHVYPFCTKEHLELDIKDIHSFVFYSNFGLSKTQYKICVTIDGDHVGITDHIKIIYNYLKSHPIQDTALFFSGIELHQRPDDSRYYINSELPAVGNGDHAYWTVSPQHIFGKNPNLSFCEGIQFNGLTHHYLGFIYWHTSPLKKNQRSINGGKNLDGEFLEIISHIETVAKNPKLALLSPELKQANKDFHIVSAPRFSIYFDFGSLPDVRGIYIKSVYETLQLAIQHHRANRLEQAEQAYRQVLETHPDHPEALHSLGILAQQFGRYQEAENFLSTAQKAQPGSVKVWFSLGNLRSSQGQLKEAEEAYSQAISLKPDAAPLYNNLGYCLQQQGKLDEAIALYQKALHLQPNCIEADVNWGNALHAQGKLSQEKQVHYAQLNRKLGLARKNAGDFNNAIAYYRQAIAMQQDLCETYYNLSIVLQEKGEFEEAIACCHQALKLDTKNWKIYNRLGLIYQQQNNQFEAIALYRQGLNLLNPHYAQAAIAYQGAGTTEEAPVTPPIPQGEVTVGAYQFPMIPAVVDADKPRPFWSVVIPVCNRTDYLLECLASVLVQWPGQEEMEILVVDNASIPPLYELVNSLGRGIIRYYRHPENIGAVGNHNAGIALSRGQWVHVLHDDDCVVPGFYKSLQKSLENCPDSVGVACTGFEYINQQGEAIATGEIVSIYGEQRGIIKDWLYRIGVCGLVTIPAMVVRRTTHERLGGYYPELPEICDWEIFKRYASFCDWWYEPGILARYREHTQKMTYENNLSGKLASAIRHAIEVSDSYFPASIRASLTALARIQNFNYCLQRAAIPLQAGNFTGALSVLQEVIKIDSSPQALANLFAWLTQEEVAPLREEIVCRLLLTPENNSQGSTNTGREAALPRTNVVLNSSIKNSKLKI
ncbi:family 2 glycosyl transferase [Calothrix sp. NIES-4071]|nr:family 2 glycosyl transferase [Calothrix sp. NIES-4071]BAZ61774.1 family 2 glycosyl transferase [Calothrix sp. NIES-4105]